MSTKIRRFLVLALAVVGLGAASAWGYFEAMKRAWIRYNQYDLRSEGSLTVGDLAPDLELSSLDGAGAKKISDLYREKPVVLIFGSYT